MRMFLSLSSFITAAFVTSVSAWAEPPVELELVIRGRVTPTAPQRWNRILGQVGFSRPTIRSERIGDEFGIADEGTERRPVYRVTGYLLDDSTILLPPRTRFTVRDTTALAKWVAELKANGIESAVAGTTAFGLTTSRFEQVRADLKSVLRFPTKGADARELVERIARTLRFPIRMDGRAERALAVDDPVRDNLLGLSTGTALAAVLRPAGLVLRPRYRAGQLEYAIVDAREKGDNWPIGWATKENSGKLMPTLFDRQETVEVEVPLSAALVELSSRTKVPFLLDHNGLALRRIDPQRTMVTIRGGKTYSGAILRHVLSQAGLQDTPRVDENDKPFLWISPVR